MSDYEEIQARLGVRFANPAILETALIHSSFVNETADQSISHNERLEFLGDAVLGMWIAERLFRDFPDEPEGTLTRYRSLLVRRETLAFIADELQLGEALYLGRGEIRSGGRRKPANLSRALEAVIAAVYLDRGYDTTGQVIDRLFERHFADLPGMAAAADSKSHLQEIVQGRYHTPPEYRIIEENGPDNAQSFTAEVIVNGQVRGTGRGSRKKDAETAAAQEALEYFRNTLHLE
ncbi:ribonuclease III [Dehalogenimonas lykanthroporepellens BL-DC-9]|nr:ribonuclease III [Dehalogenimonas lykanthroporepellens BL-DC-9]